MQPQAPGIEPPAAQCALHAGEPFTSICPRCGTYMCSKCSDAGRFELCTACRERTGTGSFPLRRDTWTIEALLRHSYEAYRRNLAPVTLASVVTLVVIIAFNFIGQLISFAFPDQMFVSALVSIVLIIPQLVAQGALTLGMISISLAAARGDTPNVGMLFSQFSRVGSWFVQSLAIYLVILPLALVVGVPVGIMAAQGSFSGALIAGVVAGVPATIAFVYAMAGIMFGNAELVHDPKIGALAALKSSWRIAAGQRWAILGCWMVFAGVMLAGVIALLIGVVFAMGFASVMFGSLFLALKNGQPQDS